MISFLLFVSFSFLRSFVHWFVIPLVISHVLLHVCSLIRLFVVRLIVRSSVVCSYVRFSGSAHSFRSFCSVSQALCIRSVCSGLFFWLCSVRTIPFLRLCSFDPFVPFRFSGSAHSFRSFWSAFQALLICSVRTVPFFRLC